MTPWRLCMLAFAGTLASCGQSTPPLLVQVDDSVREAPDRQTPAKPSADSSARPTGLESPAIEEQKGAWLSLMSAASEPEGRLPLSVTTLEFALHNADFAQIVRCSGDQDWPSQDLALASSKQKEWLWREVLAASDSCEIVSLRALPGIFQDILVTASESSRVVQYLLNPCRVDPEQPDSLDAALCSHDLAVTPQLQVHLSNPGSAGVDQLSLSEAVSALASARSKAEGLATRLRALAAHALNLEPICDKQAARERSLEQVRWGLGQLATLGVNAALAHAGPLAGLPFVQTAIRGVLRKLFESPVRLPASCQDLKTTLSEMEKLSERHEEATARWEELLQTLDELGEPQPEGLRDQQTQLGGS